ncbi:MAG: Tyrosine recombinase XerC [Chloroflexi bacterium ADurb.Bin325]|nr:MAG: Tyrosine recombinase XerC [Chloroflexi bacterium ADurb.Bin325]
MTELVTTTALGPVVGLPSDRNPALVYLAGLAPGARRTMRQALDSLAAQLTGGACDAETCPWAALRFQHTAALRATLIDRYAPATANKMLSALRGTLRAAQRLGQMTADDCQGAASVQNIRGGAEDPRGRALPRGELAALLGACTEDTTPAGLRDAAVIALLYACGPRRAELVGLDLADLQTDGDGATWLVIRHGKGNKARRVPVANGALMALQDWLAVRGDTPGPLFVPVNKGGRLILGQRMTPQAIMGLLTKRGTEANIPDFSPHDLRRTFISDLLDRGADIATVQKLAGHAQVTTTARYDRRGDRAKRAAVDLLSVPYTRRRLGDDGLFSGKLRERPIHAPTAEPSEAQLAEMGT